MIVSSEQTQNQIKTILHTNFKLWHVWNAEKNASLDMQEISLIECSKCLLPVLIHACRRLQKLVIGLKNISLWKL